MTSQALDHRSGQVREGADRPTHQGGAACVPLPERLHLLGAGGAGLSGAARLLLARGFQLTGHDREAGPFTAVLRDYGVPLELGLSATDSLPADAAGVIRSAAVAADDPQVLRARERGLPVWKYAEVLGRLAPAAQTLAVAGTHGKTTTTWMLQHALEEIHTELGGGADSAPGALVGGLHHDWKTNALPPGRDGWFSLEACEYDRSFLHLHPAGALVTNVEADHLDCYGDLAAIERAFARFLSQVQQEGLVVLGSDVPECVARAVRGAAWRLGIELRAVLCGVQAGYFRMRVQGPGWGTPEFQLQVPGEFNVHNAAAALGLAVGSTLLRSPGLDPERVAAAAARGVAGFRGVARRFESWGRVRGVPLVHDYAHHPTEVAATCEAARRVFPGQPLHVLFQPHQHSRTARFLGGFIEALRGVQSVVIADVYGARTHTDEVFAGAPELVEGLRKAGVRAQLGGPAPDAARMFAEKLPHGCAALILGAGDIDRVREDLRDELALRGAC